jgi:uncharacterized protein
MPTLIDALIDDDSAPYWAALDASRLMLQRCPDCGYLRPPSVYRTRQPAAWVCPQCLAPGGDWVQVSGEATVETFVWYLTDLVGPNPDFAPFKLALPYNVALVRLAEGPRVITNVVEVGFPDLVVGQSVRAAFIAIQDRTLLRFRPS